ncbi:MAG: hypothetical protein ACYDDV_04090 [Methanoregula sp.]
MDGEGEKVFVRGETGAIIAVVDGIVDVHLPEKTARITRRIVIAFFMDRVRYPDIPGGPGGGVRQIRE